MSASILDIETLGQNPLTILESLPPWDEAEARQRVPKNYKKEEAIAGWLEDDKANHGKDAIEKAALNPETATIAIVGFWRDGRVHQLVANKDFIPIDIDDTAEFISSEAGLVSEAFAQMKKRPRDGVVDPILGWNLHGMDLRMLIRRAWILGVKVPRTIYNPLLRYPIPERFVDMMERYGVRRGEKFFSLNSALKAMGLPEKGDGKEFGKLWQEDRAKALEYSANELRGQAELYRRMGVDL